MDFGEPKKPSQKKKLVSSGTTGTSEERELMGDVVDLYAILKKQGLSLDDDTKNSKKPENCYTQKEIQNIESEKKPKKSVTFSSSGGFGGCAVGGEPKKSSMGNENPDFQEYVIVPSKKKWGEEDTQQDKEKQIQNNSLKNLDYKDKNYVLRLVDGQNQQEQQSQQIQSKSQKKFEQEEQEEIQPTKKQPQQQKNVEQIEKEKQELFLTQNRELIEQKIQEEEDQKVHEIQKKIVDLMLKQPDETSDKNPNRPSKQLDQFQYYEQFLEDEKKKEEDKKNNKAGFKMPAMYSNQNSQQQQQLNNEEENQDSQGNNEEEEYHEEKDTNDSEAYGGMYEISRELISENIEKKEKIFRIKYNNNDMYEGEIDEKTQLKDGWGTYFYGNGEKYEGFFEDDLINGFGKYWFLGGHYYEGDWYDGLKQGVGELTFNNKDKYEGQFYQDNFHGQGIFKYHNGDVFDGIWDEGKKNGKGCFKTQGAKGHTIIGVWVNDELQQF